VEKHTSEFDLISRPFWKTNGNEYPIHQVVKIKVIAIRKFQSPAYQYEENVSESTISERFFNIYSERFTDSINNLKSN